MFQGDNREYIILSPWLLMLLVFSLEVICDRKFSQVLVRTSTLDRIYVGEEMDGDQISEDLKSLD